MSHLTNHNRLIGDHFDALAPRYLELKDRNRYYNRYLVRWCRSLLPPGRKVLDVGCGRGDVLAAVEPSVGLGIDLSAAMARHAARDHAELELEHGAIEDFTGDGTYDAALLVNVLEYTYDLGTVLDRVHDALRDNGRIFVATANPLWSPIFKLASRLGLRIPECKRLFVTNEDLVNLLGLHGFAITYKRMALILPKYLPLLGSLINWTISYVPVLRLLSSTQLIVARKLPPKRRSYGVSVVVPCYNEVGNVDACVREMRRFGERTELIFVDDGSTDGTAAAIKPGLNPDVEVRVVEYSPNRGKGHAVKTGLDSARGDILVILDADLTTHPEELGPLYEAFATGRAEFVNCTRFIYPMADQAMPLLNYLGNKFFAILVSLVMEARVSDTLCGTKAMFRRDYQHMTMGRDPWGDYDFLFGAAQMRLAICELPVHYRERLAGITKMNTPKHTLNLLRMCWKGFWQVKTLAPLPKRRADAG